MIEHSDFFGYDKYTITVGELSVSLITLGAAITSVRYRGRELALGYETAREYENDPFYMGRCIGRTAGRVSGAAFSMDGVSYPLATDKNGQHLHGGPEGFDKRRWSAEIICANRIRFALLSRDGDAGYPGNLAVAVTYTVEDDSLRMDYEAEADRETCYAPTNHVYFNPGGGDSILDTALAINAAGRLITDEKGFPTGEIAPAEGEYDFSSLRPIGQQYDDCFLLAGSNAAMAEQGETGLALRTDFPALVLYTGNALDGKFKKNQGFCLEAGFCPDSVNHSEFGLELLHKGERFHRFAEYHFYRRSE